MTPGTGTLVIHPGALGDVLLAVPALRLLRSGADGALALAAQPRIAALLAALAVVDRPLAFESLGLERLFASAPGEAPAVVDAVARARRVVCWFGARDPVFTRQLRAVAPGAVIESPNGAGLDVWKHLVATVTDAGGEADGCERLRAAIVVPQSLRDAGRRALLESGLAGAARALLVHPGAGGAGKRWPVEGFAQVIESAAATHGPAVVLHEGPADSDAVRALETRLRGRLPTPLLRLDRPELPVLAGVLSHATVYLGNDSGVSHLAAAVGAPSVVLFTTVNLAWRPWSQAAQARVVDLAALDREDVAAVSATIGGILAASAARRATAAGPGRA